MFMLLLMIIFIKILCKTQPSRLTHRLWCYNLEGNLPKIHLCSIYFLSLIERIITKEKAYGN